MDKQTCKSTPDTEQLILEAAVKEFSTKGFDGARTSAIASAAGVTHAMLHYYFRTKENLFERIFKEKLGYIIDMVLTPVIESEGDIRSRIVKAVEAHFDFILANRDLPVFFITTVLSRPEAYRDVISGLSSVAAERIAALQKELDKAHRRGEICKVDAISLVGDVASLNVFPFLAYRMVMAVAASGPDDFEVFLRARKRESVEMILKRLS